MAGFTAPGSRHEGGRGRNDAFPRRCCRPCCWQGLGGTLLLLLEAAPSTASQTPSSAPILLLQGRWRCLPLPLTPW